MAEDSDFDDGVCLGDLKILTPDEMLFLGLEPSRLCFNFDFDTVTSMGR
jgi:hypothetical protein